MIKWLYKLNFKSFYHEDNISIINKGKMIAKLIMKLPLEKIEYYAGDDLEDVADHFDSIGGCDFMTEVEEFDEAMSELYDMADRYDIWITTRG